MKARRTSLAVQSLRIHLPMQGTHVWSLVPQDSPCWGATTPMATATESVLWCLQATATEPTCPRAHSRACSFSWLFTKKSFFNKCNKFKTILPRFSFFVKFVDLKDSYLIVLTTPALPSPFLSFCNLHIHGLYPFAYLCDSGFLMDYSLYKRHINSLTSLCMYWLCY